MEFDKKYYMWFRVIITLLVALVYLSEKLQVYLAKEIYDFLILHKDVIIGIYYLYLAYDIYTNNFNKDNLKID
jgi:hypothetical protein